MIFQRKTFQKSQAFEQIIKSIPGAVTMYYDHRKNNEY